MSFNCKVIRHKIRHCIKFVQQRLLRQAVFAPNFLVYYLFSFLFACSWTMCPSYGDITSSFIRPEVSNSITHVTIKNMKRYAKWETNFPLWRSFLCGRYLVGGLIFQDISFLTSKYDIRYHGTPADFLTLSRATKRLMPTRREENYNLLSVI